MLKLYAAILVIQLKLNFVTIVPFCMNQLHTCIFVNTRLSSLIFTHYLWFPSNSRAIQHLLFPKLVYLFLLPMRFFLSNLLETTKNVISIMFRDGVSSRNLRPTDIWFIRATANGYRVQPIYKKV